MKKKIAILILSAVFLLSQSGCSVENNEAETQAEVKVEESEYEAPVEEDVSVLTLSTGTVEENEWGDDYKTHIARMSYPVVDMSESSKVAYPELAEALSVMNDAKKKSTEEEYSGMLEYAKELYSEQKEGVLPLETTENVRVRRADSKVVSLLFGGYMFGGGAHGNFYFVGENYDSKTGKLLKLSDVVTDTSLLVPLIYDELDRFYKDITFFEDIDLAEVISDEESISWTFDHGGITIYFNPYVLAPYSEGVQVVKISSSENPGLIKEEYQSNISSFGVELTENLPFYFDLDGDGEQDKINVSSIKGEFDKESLSIEMNDIGHTEEIFAYSLKPTFVHTKDGNFLYVETLSDNDYREILCYSFGSKIEKNGSQTGGMHCVYSEGTDGVVTYEALTNPESFVMDVRTNVLSSVTGYSVYSITKSGEFRKEQERYSFDEADMYELTLMTELYVDIYDIDAEQITDSRVLKENEKVKYYATDGERFAYLLLSDGSVGRIEVNCRQWPITVGEIDIYDLFSGMMFAG